MAGNFILIHNMVFKTEILNFLTMFCLNMLFGCLKVLCC